MENDNEPANDVAKVLTFPRKAPKVPAAPVLDGKVPDKLVFMIGPKFPLKTADVAKIIQDSKLQTFHIQLLAEPKTMDDIVQSVLLFRETITEVGHEYLLEIYQNMQRMLHAFVVLLEVQRLEFNLGMSYMHTPFGATLVGNAFKGDIKDNLFFYQDIIESTCDLDFTET